MCFFSFPSPRKKRRNQIAESEQLLPRKRRVAFPAYAQSQRSQTHASGRSVTSASRSSSRHSDHGYKPLKGHGAKRTMVDPPVKQERMVLRGSGVKRDSSRQESQLMKSQPEMSERRRRPAPSDRQSSQRTATKSPSVRAPSSQRTPASSKAQRGPRSVSAGHTSAVAPQRYSVSSASAYMPYQQQQHQAHQRSPYNVSYSSRDQPSYGNASTNYTYTMPNSSYYYHDLSAVRAATSQALQSQYPQVSYSRNLRRQPGYTRLR